MVTKNIAIKTYFQNIKFMETLLIIMLIFFPFQKFPLSLIKYYNLENTTFFLPFLAYIDEIFIVLLSLYYILFYYKKTSLIHYSIGILFIFVLFTAITKHISLLQFCIGFFDYIKSFLPLIILSSIKFEEQYLKKIINILINVALLLAVFGIIGEILSIINEPNFLVRKNALRFGFYRVISLTGHGNWNYLGMFTVFIFFIIKQCHPERFSKNIKLLLLLLIIILTGSRQAFIGFVAMYILLSNHRVLIIFLCIVSASIIFQSEYLIANIFTGQELNSDTYFRYFAFLQSLDLIKEHFLFGVGVGNFGTMTSVLFDSYYYHSWPETFKNYVYQTKGIDQYWIAIFAEIGLLGFILYSSVICILYQKIYIAQKTLVNKSFLIELGRVIKSYFIVFIIMGLLSGINSPFVSMTFFIVAGIYLSSIKHNDKQYNYAK